MTIRSLGISAVRLLSPLFAWPVGQAAAEKLVRFFEALQGIGTGAEFSRRECNAIFAQMSAAPSIVFDVGAHVGHFLREALQRTEAGCVVHAFEPAAASFRELSKSFGNENRVRLNRVALGDISGSGVLFYDEPGSQLASLTARPRFGNAKSESVRTQTLDEYCQQNQITQIDLLKLDVEGHELEALEGSAGMLGRAAIHRILFEFGGCNIDSRVFFRDLYEVLRSKRMRIFRVMPNGKLLPIDHYDESLERFRTTNYLATFEPPR